MIKEVQSIRFFAILMVIFVHSPIIFPEEWGSVKNAIWKVFHTSTGVELFFVLAGYFMMASLEKLEISNYSKANGAKLVVEFIIKKFKRLAPSAYFWVFVALFFSVFLPNKQLFLEPYQMAQKVFSTILWVRNFNEAAEPTHLGYFWAISLEFQFFVIFSAIYLFLGKKYIIYISVLFCLIMMIYRPGEKMGWLFRFDPMLYGVLIYYFIRYIGQDFLENIFKAGRKSKVFISLLLVASLSAVLPMLAMYSNFKFSVSSITAAFMLLLALSNNGYFYPKNRILSTIVDYIASRSYALFCTHILVWCIVKRVYILLGIDNQLSLFLFAIVAMFIASEFSYRYIENLLVVKK